MRIREHKLLTESGGELGGSWGGGVDGGIKIS